MHGSYAPGRPPVEVLATLTRAAPFRASCRQYSEKLSYALAASIVAYAMMHRAVATELVA